MIPPNRFFTCGCRQRAEFKPSQGTGRFVVDINTHWYTTNVHYGIQIAHSVCCVNQGNKKSIIYTKCFPADGKPKAARFRKSAQSAQKKAGNTAFQRSSLPFLLCFKPVLLHPAGSIPDAADSLRACLKTPLACLIQHFQTGFYRRQRLVVCPRSAACLWKC
jgi:hypothetical protein